MDSSTDVTAKRRDLKQSLNFELPPDWIAQGNLHVEVSFSAEGYSLGLACDGCQNLDRWGSLGYVQFQNAPPVRLSLWSADYTTSTSPGATVFSPRSIDFTLLQSWLRRAYPTSAVLLEGSGAIVYLTGTAPSCNDINSDLSDMRSMDVTSGQIDRRTHYCALASDAGVFVRGCAPVPGIAASGPAGTPSSAGYSWDMDASFADWYGGHELGHTYGRNHPGFCNQTHDDNNYPFPNGMIGNPSDYFGFDVGDAANGIARQVYDPSLWTDVMTYCNNQWISPYTYNGILDRLYTIETHPELLGGPSPQTAGDNLLVSAILNVTRNTAELRAFWRLPDLLLTSRPASSAFTIILLNNQGTTLAAYPFEPKRDVDTPPGEDQMALVCEVVPFAQGTSRIVISNNGQELASRPVSANSPSVANVQVGANTNGVRLLSWQATDADSTNLTYSVEYSADGGTNWQSIAITLSQPQFSLDLQTLRGSSIAKCRVIASDGVNTGSADSPSFVVSNKPPQAQITSPANASSFTSSQTIVLAGEGLDLEDGNLDGAALQWRSDRQGALGSGRLLGVNGLVPGTHTITLTATDRAGAVGQAAVQIQVSPQLALADAGTNRFVAVGSHVPLDASHSTGVGPLTNVWQIAVKPPASQASLANSNAVQTEFIADAAGTYEIVLLIRDAVGGGATTRLVVTSVDSSTFADLAITGSAAPNPVRAGELLSYVIVVYNIGPGTATGVTMTDTLPGGVHFVSAPGCSVSGNNVTCTLPPLASGNNASINVNVTVDCGVSNLTTIVNSASVTTTAPETNLVNNVVSISDWSRRWGEI